MLSHQREQLISHSPVEELFMSKSSWRESRSFQGAYPLSLMRVCFINVLVALQCTRCLGKAAGAEAGQGQATSRL